MWYSLHNLTLSFQAYFIVGMAHGHGKIELPDYKQWKIEGTPLQRVQERLAKQGLKDPWLRNEAWRYMGRFGNPHLFILDRDQCV
uniref:NADH dehydrogenase [ubiquinone] 1 beta subcomplex subunit 3 n=1 Tax=Monodelphis domestica TaxID=13616 RepID=A0A5F8H1H8_MONDO